MRGVLGGKVAKTTPTCRACRPWSTVGEKVANCARRARAASRGVTGTGSRTAKRPPPPHPPKLHSCSICQRDRRTERRPPRARRRTRRRGRPLGDRRGIPPPDQVPAEELRDPRGQGLDRWNLGAVPLPGHPLGLGHVHAWVLVPALVERQVDRRRPVDPQLRPGDRERERDRPQGPLAPPGHKRHVVNGRPALACRGTSNGHRRDRPPDRGLRIHVQRLLPLRRGLHARLPWHPPVRGPDRASAVLERRH